ncbi:hypothetical protein GQ53DRAFT_817996 [Thozetella sp. PMI_491]|nr:hypothetical protein GQ53DRAFT_817996 [Thozetella sp. PMI_491]
MRFSAILSIATIGQLASGALLPQKRDATLTVLSDTGSASITVPTTGTDAESGVGGGADIAGAVADIIGKVTNLIQGLIDDDTKRRQAFTQNTVARVRQATGQNVVMSNVGYNFQGTFTSRTSTKYKAKVGSDVSFDVITFKSGTFDLKGDGGFQNASFSSLYWAYIVDGTCTADAKAKHISCA